MTFMMVSGVREEFLYLDTMGKLGCFGAAARMWKDFKVWLWENMECMREMQLVKELYGMVYCRCWNWMRKEWSVCRFCTGGYWWKVIEEWEIWMGTNSCITLRHWLAFGTKYQLIGAIGYMAWDKGQRCCRRRNRIVQRVEINGDLYAALVLISTL